MTQKELIRKEIDMYIKSFELNGGIYDSYEAGELSAYKEILAFIDSLPDNDFLDESIIASKDIEEEMERMWLNWCEDVDYLSYLSIARYFAEWQKEQIMKEAVEGEIVKDISNKLAVTAKNVNLDGFKFGDKVKIIIVKEDGNSDL